MIEVGAQVRLRCNNLQLDVWRVDGKLVWVKWQDPRSKQERESVVHADMLEALPED